MTQVGDKVTVFMPVWAEYSIEVEVTEEMVGDDGEVDYDLVMDEAYDQRPSGLCYGCSTGNSGASWGKNSPISLELSDDAEVRYIVGPDNKVVWGDPTAKLGW